MEAILLPPLQFPNFSPPKIHQENPRFRISCSPVRAQTIGSTKSEYKPGPLDDLFLGFFRQKMVEVNAMDLWSYAVFGEITRRCIKEVGWDSEKPGYDGLIEVVNRLMMKGKSNLETEQSAVRVLKSLFPSFLLPLFKLLIAPIGGGRVASMMVARATALSCQWLMGPCSVNSVDLPDGSSCTSGVFVERCKYLEESKCIGICIKTCKLPTQFKFGVAAPLPSSDQSLEEPCLEICPNANRRKELSSRNLASQCPQV